LGLPWPATAAKLLLSDAELIKPRHAAFSSASMVHADKTVLGS
jgi:hypothetical protein